METSKLFTEAVQFLHSLSPEAEFAEEQTDQVVAYIEDNYFPEVVKIIQKEEAFFASERPLFGCDLSHVWKVANDEQKSTLWKNLQAILFASFLHGDIKAKVGKLLGVFKNVWSASGQQNDDLTRILEDEKSEGYLQELLDYVMECRLAKIFLKMVEDFDISDLELNFESPAELIEMMKNPEHPTIKRVMSRVQNMIEEKMKRGELTQQLIMTEVEGIKAKVMGLFGNVFNEALGGRKADVPANVLMGNSPEARRQRMLARLQRKVRDKNSK